MKNWIRSRTRRGKEKKNKQGVCLQDLFQVCVFESQKFIHLKRKTTDKINDIRGKSVRCVPVPNDAMWNTVLCFSSQESTNTFLQLLAISKSKFFLVRGRVNKDVRCLARFVRKRDWINNTKCMFYRFSEISREVKNGTLLDHKHCVFLPSLGDTGKIGNAWRLSFSLRFMSWKQRLLEKFMAVVEIIRSNMKETCSTFSRVGKDAKIEGLKERANILGRNCCEEQAQTRT